MLDPKVFKAYDVRGLYGSEIDEEGAYAIGHATHEECDELGMTAALRTAGCRALAQLAMQGY